MSPIVGGVALKGPADRMLVELGHDPSVVGVARLYAPIADALVIDPVDAELAPQVEAAGMRAVVVDVDHVDTRHRRCAGPGHAGRRSLAGGLSPLARPARRWRRARPRRRR